MFNAKKGQVQLGNTRMGYASFGKGGKILVILPGLSLNGVTGTAGAAEALAHMYRVFSKEYTVYFFDRKDDIPENYTVYGLADDTAEAMKALKIEKACVFGVSQGGMIAQALAVKYPDIVEKLVLGATLSRPNDTAREVVGKWVEYAEKGDFVSLNNDTFEKLYTQDYLKKNRLLLPAAAKMKPDDPERFIRLARSCVTFDIYGELDKIKCPVLVLGAEKDLVVTPEASREIAQKLNCEIYMYENYGHAVYDEAKDFKQRIYDFLQKN